MKLILILILKTANNVKFASQDASQAALHAQPQFAQRHQVIILIKYFLFSVYNENELINLAFKSMHDPNRLHNK